MVGVATVFRTGLGVVDDRVVVRMVLSEDSDGDTGVESGGSVIKCNWGHLAGSVSSARDS